jgi:hypothetical protein
MDGRVLEYSSRLCHSIDGLRQQLERFIRLLHEHNIEGAGGARCAGHVHLSIADKRLNAYQLDCCFAVAFAPFIVMLQGRRHSFILGPGVARMPEERRNTRWWGNEYQGDTPGVAIHVEVRFPPSPLVKGPYLEAWLEGITLGCWLYENIANKRATRSSPDTSDVSGWRQIMDKNLDLYARLPHLQEVVQMAERGVIWTREPV